MWDFPEAQRVPIPPGRRGDEGLRYFLASKQPAKWCQQWLISKFWFSNQGSLRALSECLDPRAMSNMNLLMTNYIAKKWIHLGMSFVNEGMKGTEWLWCCGPEGHFQPQPGDIMRLAGISLKENAVTDEKVVVQTIKLTRSSKAQHMEAFFTAFRLNRSGWPCSLSSGSWVWVCSFRRCTPCWGQGRIFAQQQFYSWRKVLSIVVLNPCQ